MTEEQADRGMTEAEKNSLAEFKSQITELLEGAAKDFAKDLMLSDAQQMWVENKLNEALKEEKILKDSPNDEYEDFTEDAKEALKPAIRQALEFKAMETEGVAIRSHAQGTFYGEVQKRMHACGVKNYRGFCKLTGYSHTAVYQKVKIAESYTRESLETYPGIDLKALYEVAAKKGDHAAETLEKNHSALVKAGSDVHEVRKVLDPNYERPQKPAPEVAITPDGTIRAEFHAGKNGRGKIVIIPAQGNVGVSKQDWLDLQLWLLNQDSWARFMAWEKLQQEKSVEQESEFEEAQGASEEVSAPVGAESGEKEILTSKELFAFCEARWSDPKACEDDGNVNVAPLYGVENLHDPGWLRGEVFIQYKEDGAENLFRETIFTDRFPLTSQHVTKQLEKIRKDYPHVSAVMFADKDEQFVVGTKILDGNPVTRWAVAGNA